MFVTLRKKKESSVASLIEYVFEAFEFLQYKIMAYVEKEKKVMHHSAKISFPFCEIIHYSQLAPFRSQKRNTVRNQKKMEMK